MKILQDEVFRTPEKLFLSLLAGHWECLIQEDRGLRELLLFLIDLVPLLEEIKGILLPLRSGPGRLPKSRLGQFLFFIYLLYFSMDTVERTMRRVNKNSWLQQCLCLPGIELTDQSFGRFLIWLENGLLDQIFHKLVRIGIKNDLVSLNHHVIDTGKVIANVNPSRFLSWPVENLEAIAAVIEQLDLSRVDGCYPSQRGRWIPASVKLKLYLLQLVAGLGSLSQVHSFLKKHPLIQLQMGLPLSLPGEQTVRNFLAQRYSVPGMEQAFQELLFPLACALFDQPEACLPESMKTIEDLYGSLGNRYSRVDRGARVGYKPSDKSFWVGYKDHVSIDAGSGMPVTVTVTAANMHDTNQYSSHLKTIQQEYGDLVTVKQSFADRGYDSAANRAACRETLDADPCIINRSASEEERKLHRAWSSIRQAVERSIGAARVALRKNYPRVRGQAKVAAWVKMAYLVVLMIGLVLFLNGEPELVNHVTIFKE